MSPRRWTGVGLALALAGCATHRPTPVHIGQVNAPAAGTKPAPLTPTTIRPPAATGLDTLVRLDLPAGLPNIEAGALYVLRGSGYAFTGHCTHCPPNASLIAKEPISPLAYTGGITTVRRALLLIGGFHRRLLVDDRAKLVTYDEWTGS